MQQMLVYLYPFFQHVGGVVGLGAFSLSVVKFLQDNRKTTEGDNRKRAYIQTLVKSNWGRT